HPRADGPRDRRLARSGQVGCGIPTALSARPTTERAGAWITSVAGRRTGSGVELPCVQAGKPNRPVPRSQVHSGSVVTRTLPKERATGPILTKESRAAPNQTRAGLGRLLRGGSGANIPQLSEDSR